MARRKALDRGWAHATHERWKSRVGQHPGAHYRHADEEKRMDQCGGCTYFLNLDRRSLLEMDWGVCTAPLSPVDGQVVFEHDGCDAYIESPTGWE